MDPPLRTGVSPQTRGLTLRVGDRSQSHMRDTTDLRDYKSIGVGPRPIGDFCHDSNSIGRSDYEEWMSRVRFHSSVKRREWEREGGGGSYPKDGCSRSPPP